MNLAGSLNLPDNSPAVLVLWKSCTSESDREPPPNLLFVIRLEFMTDNMGTKCTPATRSVALLLELSSHFSLHSPES